MRVFLLSTMMMAAAVASAPAADSPPNIVFLLIDDLGWTDLGCFGSDLFETPNIDRLAAEGMRFTNAYSACTVCSPTRAAVMTGKYPARLHVTDWIHGHGRPFAPLTIPEWTHHLPSQETTMAEALKPLGYRCASVGKWHLGDDAPYWPTAQGFDVNVAGYGAGSPPSYFDPYGRAGSRGDIPTLAPRREGEYLTDRLTDETIRLIGQWKDRPFYLYLPHYTVHTPLQAKPELIEKYRAKARPGMKHTNPVYAAMIESLDQGVGRLMAKLEELHLAENTILVFTSDNGGLMAPGNSTDNRPLRLGKGSAYEGGVRVPLIVRWPKIIRRGQTCDEPVISVDYFPTLLEAAGGSPIASPNVDGVSFAPLLRQPGSILQRKAIFWHYPHYHPGGATPYGAVRSGHWRLVEFYTDMHVELYNLKNDIGETTDLSQRESEKTAELKELLHQWRAAVGAQMPAPNPNADPQKDAPRPGKKKKPPKTGREQASR